MQKNDSFTESVKAPLSIKFDNIVGDEHDLKLDTVSYINSSGETFTVSALKYFISNISLKKSDGTEYTVPQDSSYFYIDEADAASQRITINVPEGEYASLTFTLGVDSLRSTKDISQRTGVLQPDANNYWDENKGYIFYSIQGNSTTAFNYQIGGYGGKLSPTINNIKTITLNLVPGGVAKVHTGHTSSIHLMVDVLKMFTGATDISIATYPTIGFDNFSTSVADNYSNMFRHDHTHN